MTKSKKYFSGIRKYVKAIFFSKGGPQPVYGYIFIMLSLVGTMLILRILHALGIVRLVDPFSDALILGICGFVAVWAGIITARDIKKSE